MKCQKISKAHEQNFQITFLPITETTLTVTEPTTTDSEHEEDTLGAACQVATAIPAGAQVMLYQGVCQPEAPPYWCGPEDERQLVGSPDCTPSIDLGRPILCCIELDSGEPFGEPEEPEEPECRKMSKY